MRFMKILPRLGDRSMPFVSMDWFFPLFPNITRDKFHWFSRYIQGSFISGAVFVLFVYHTPFASAEYDHEWKSPFYRWKREQLLESGKLAENLRVKYSTFYQEEKSEE
jgi:hypothetical protein